ncbi:MAG: AbrB/MazE/SpoVT family DNA-binding domain-containing protein [Planctomycetaceae bacterium]
MAKIQRWGNSLAIRIPKVLAEEVDVTDGAEVDITVREGELIISPRSTPKLSLKELLRNCRPSQRHEETDFGIDVGREVLE